MTDMLFGDIAGHMDFNGVNRCGDWADMGVFHHQRFYAVHAADTGFSLPFSACPFTVMADMTDPADDAVLREYAGILIRHGCVQAICRGEESYRLHRIFEDLAETGELDRNGPAFTSMCMEDEPRMDALRYFLLPCGLAKTKLFLIIGGRDDYEAVLDDFLDISGSAGELLGSHESLDTASAEICGYALRGL